MEFFEGKRVRKLRDTFNEALEVTLKPQTPEVRGPRARDAIRVERSEKNSEGEEIRSSVSRPLRPRSSMYLTFPFASNLAGVRRRPEWASRTGAWAA